MKRYIKLTALSVLLLLASTIGLKPLSTSANQTTIKLPSCHTGAEDDGSPIQVPEQTNKAPGAQQ
ncbi:hypothetical protein [Paenibacillus caui]|uniref:hypothetical protein n=1 Tax=Paenibacillus caui TaxID=2873927 RepID=UPI001CA7F66F|nr:hypothetical protein [Paenibacillus caui]